MFKETVKFSNQKNVELIMIQLFSENVQREQMYKYIPRVVLKYEDSLIFLKSY